MSEIMNEILNEIVLQVTIICCAVAVVLAGIAPLLIIASKIVMPFRLKKDSTKTILDPCVYIPWL